MLFLLEKKKLEEYYDFELALLKSKELFDWQNQQIEIHFINIDETMKLLGMGYISQFRIDLLRRYTPVGSLEFVNLVTALKDKEIRNALKGKKLSKEESLYFIENVFKHTPKPLNVPEQLFSFAGRKIDIVKNKDIEQFKNVFVKSNIKYKGEVNFHSSGLWDSKEFNEEEYFVSELVNIEAEFRIFCMNNEILDIKNYDSKYEYYQFLDIPKIKEMIDIIYKNHSLPNCYTLDVYINDKNEMHLLEMHPFVSCGLYGFNRLNLLPHMLLQGYKYYKNNK